MDPLESIKNLTNSTPSTIRFWVCPACRHVEEIDMAKAMPSPECPGCKARIQRVARPTAESAQEAIKNLENAERLKREGLVGAPPVSTPPAAVEPKLTAEPAPSTTAAQTPAAPAPKKLEPAQAEKRGKRKAEKGAPAAAPAPVAPTPEPEIPATLASVEPGMADAQALRAAALAAFIAKHKLTEHAWTRLGSGRVLSHGFTVWTEDEAGNRRPTYTIRDLADSGEYAQSLKQARASDGSVATDVVVVTALPAELRPLVWAGELIASLRDGSQTHAPKVGQTVQLSAKVSRTGRLVWCVCGVA